MGELYPKKEVKPNGNFKNYTIQGIDMEYPNSPLHVLFESCAKENLDAIALQFETERITYGELREKINRIAQYLWSTGVRPGQIVAISLDRNPDLVASLFAILQCGAAYLPIDPNYPNTRTEFMITDARADYFICKKEKQALLHSATTLFISDVLKGMPARCLEPLDHTTDAETLAYIIYTSGSTGKPKGVKVAHRNAVNLICSLGKSPGIDQKDKIFAVTTISFDAMVMEIFLPLLHGACVVLVDEDTRRDGRKLLEKAKREGISVMWGTPSIWQILLNAGWDTPLDIKILIGGEPVPLALARKLLPQCRELWNIYGPTETTVCSFTTRITEDDDPITVGTPIANTYAYLLDEQGQPVSPGEIGEIAIGGDGVSMGYLDRRELTKEAFVTDSLNKIEGAKIYRSGDFGKLLPNGQLQCLGRADGQVKIRGHRIELGEIEGVLNEVPIIERAKVSVSNVLYNEPRLVAHLIAKTGNHNTDAVRRQLEDILPDFMMPSFFMWMTEFPITANGKIDTERLPAPEYVRPKSAPILRMPRTPLEKQLVEIWKEQLHCPEIGIDDNFFELGGTSLLTQRTVTSIRKRLDLEVPVTKMYRFPTIASFAEHIESNNRPSSFSETMPYDDKKQPQDVAIIGMAGRFPGAETIEQLWEVLRDGRETTSFFSSEELDQIIPRSLRDDPDYVKARGIVPSSKTFDAAFFGLNPKVAEAMDPQQRLFLEIAYEALEQCGHLPRHYTGSIGVYAGTGTNTYYKNNVLPNKKLLDAVGHLQADTLNEKDYIASRTAYHLNLKGPAISVQSACSTSLLAVAEAVEALRNGQCDVALAGASSITAPMHSGHLYQEGAILSPDGHCRSFDAKGKGTVFSDGAGVVVLKSLQAAQKDGDKIYGILKGIGLSNDGGNKGSFTAPSAEGQANAISRALRDARVPPSTIGYVEAHGTATPLGDPIEIEGLRMAFGEQDKTGYCAIGSIKSNMGHMTAAAGVGGLIKTVLALCHKQIPASLGFENPNPAIAFEDSPFFVNTSLRDWPAGAGARRAGVSSFGVGGTNVHVVLEEYEIAEKESGSGRPLQLIAWSAKSDKSLHDYGMALGDHLSCAATAIPLADIAYTLNRTRDSFAHRRFILAGSKQDTVEKLCGVKARSSASDPISNFSQIPGSHQTSVSQKTSCSNQSALSNQIKVVPNETVFLFPGQGAQYVQMGRALYDQEAVFRNAVDECADILKGHLDADIREIIFPDIDGTANQGNEKVAAQAAVKLRDTRFTQPALFVIEYAMAQLWMAWGITPTSLCGHSLGEFVAAHLAGVFSLPDALHLMALRGRLVGGLPQGGMLSIRMEAERLVKILPEDLSLAAVNSERACVVSGSDKAIEAFIVTMDEAEIPYRALATSHAFHSAMMDPILKDFGQAVQKMTLGAPRLPVISTVTGTRLQDSEATDPEYWTNHLRNTVRFSAALDTVLASEDAVLLEVGPGQTLTALARQKKTGRKTACIASLPLPAEGEDALRTTLNALGQLWANGIEPDWPGFYAGQSRNKVVLPSYVFDRKPCWAEPVLTAPDASTVKAVSPKGGATEIVSMGFNRQSDGLSDADRIKTGLPNTLPNTKMPNGTSNQARNDNSPSRMTILLRKIADIIENTSGIELEPADYQHSFLELGLDSLVLTQMALTCKREFDLPITFRQLNEQLSTPELLAAHLDSHLAPERYARISNTGSAQTGRDEGHPSLFDAGQSGQSKDNPSSFDANQPAYNHEISALFDSENPNGVEQHPTLDSISRQLLRLGQQLDALKNNRNSVPKQTVETVESVKVLKKPLPDTRSEAEKKEHQKPFGASPRIEKQSSGLTAKQADFMRRLTERYNAKTGASKLYAQKHRAHMSDPRVVSGFKPMTKELVYPIVIEKSSGSRLWDLDGNEYLDALNGFGSCLFGHQPDFIKVTLKNQIDLGFEVGPQHPLAGEVCELLCETTGHERAALCNTGSEAVLGAMRIARTVTGRSLIVTFTTSYHGINDEAIVRGSRKMKTFPAAAGIQPEAVQNMLVLEYGTEESLEIIRHRAHELAAVLVEPVQSRRPEFRPVAFLKEVREITTAAKTALIFDEIITGFRMHLGGMQALFDIKADIATYGKVIGGGLPIGAICGKKEYMDALDGGFWQYGDDSSPEVGVTYFAGTFVRHPLALAACKASLRRLTEKGSALQNELAEMTESLATTLNSEFTERNIPMSVTYFGSLWRIQFSGEIAYSELLFVLLREKGIHIWDGFPCFLTTAYTKEDVFRIISTVLESLDELVAAGFIPKKSISGTSSNAPKKTSEALNRPPRPGAKLGRDRRGHPAWFVGDTENEGQFVKIEL
ncbi:MAG: amino acid adenylation domain-containing protein [Pricia sp.]